MAFLFFQRESLKSVDLYWMLDWRANVFGTLIQMGTMTKWLWAWKWRDPWCIHTLLQALLLIPRILCPSSSVCKPAQSLERDKHESILRLSHVIYLKKAVLNKQCPSFIYVKENSQNNRVQWIVMILTSNFLGRLRRLRKSKR